MVWRASSMDGWGGTYWGAGKGRPGYRPSSAEDGVCTSAGRSGSDYSQGKSRARKNQMRVSVAIKNGTLSGARLERNYFHWH